MPDPISAPTETEFTHLGKEVYHNEPETLQKYLYVLRRPKPTFNAYQFIWPLRQNFCTIHQIKVNDLTGVKKDRNNIELKRDFIAAIINLFNPEVLTGYSETVNPKLAEEISTSLSVERTWISQEISQIKKLFKPSHKQFPLILEKQEKILRLSRLISEGLIEVEPEPVEVIGLFKGMTG